MDRFRNANRNNADGVTGNGGARTEPPPPESPAIANGDQEDGEVKEGEDSVLFTGMKVRRRASLLRPCKGDYVGIPSDPYFTKILAKYGDAKVLFAESVLKFTGTGKMKRRVLVITDCAIYLVDADGDVLKRRITLAAVEKLCMSELRDNFLAIIIPTEYDCLMASTRRAEIANVLVKATKSTSDYELDVIFSNRFEYNATADVKEIAFEEVDGGVKTKITRKDVQ